MKAIKMNEEAHAILKKYCKDNCLKMAAFVEKLCLDYIKEKEDVFKDRKDKQQKT